MTHPETTQTAVDIPVKCPKKLIEVALPLDDINVASARGKSISATDTRPRFTCGGPGVPWRRHEPSCLRSW